ncbi:MAG: glycosyltransferase, partial [Chitinophagaceae bacterium]
MKGKKNRNVLLYYPPNNRSVAIETIAAEVNSKGHNLIVLTTSERGVFHEQLDKLGVKNFNVTFEKRSALVYYFKHLRYLISFCRKHRIDTVWSHLQSCNIVAVLAQAFIKCRVVIFRHHFHAIIKEKGLSAVNRNELLFERIICRLAREIVVPSNEVYNGMVSYEKVPARKIKIIPYIYDFSAYPKPDASVITAITRQYAASLLIVVASRMIPMKRHMLVLPVFDQLIKEGLDIKVLLLDDGEERPKLEAYVKEQALEGRIFFLGFKKNIIDYLAASDLLVHPSATEASSSLVKEFGLMKKPVIVCSGVGDFDQYII